MNKQFQALAQQAEDWADNQNFYESDYRDYLMEKFAELIVRECIDFLNPLSRNHSMVGAAQDTIREHFGVV